MSGDKTTSLLHPGLAPDWQIGTYEWEPEADRLTWSPELIRIYGLDRAPTAEPGFSDLLHPDDRVRVEGETSTYLGSASASYSHTFRIVRPDGAVRVILDRGVIERDATGSVRLIRGVNIDVTDEARLNGAAEERLRDTEDRYRALFEAIDEGFCVIEVRLDGPDGRTDYRVVEANPAFYAKTGFPASILGRWLREAAPALEEHWYALYGGVARTGQPVRSELDSDMLGRCFDLYAFRIGAAEERRVAVLFNDISDRKRQEKHDDMLMREINHRSKNMLALVQAIARQTASSGSADFPERFGARVQALAAAQDLLFRNAWKTVPLADLIRSQLGHFIDLAGERIATAGPPLAVTPDAAQALGMALHELATNAAKYGALSTQDGRVAIRWSVETEGEAARFSLSWLERDGPPVARPERTGFGSVVTTRLLKAGTGGDVSVDYAVTGLAWRLTCPAARVVVD
ncbi:sensor histidine kinase [Marinibaculum pumilum]|uniref:histidine kinase n=1 Tax=Marinibaculum pumilum TaxID=1766165 RepID=A0ABV7L3L7_9PROT